MDSLASSQLVAGSHRMRGLPAFLAACCWLSLCRCDHDTVSVVDSGKYSVARDRRFLIYDINHGEGFNLRRDVYMRIANAVRLLREAGELWALFCRRGSSLSVFTYCTCMLRLHSISKKSASLILIIYGMVLVVSHFALSLHQKLERAV